MELQEIAEIVETMVLQQDYPGFEPRSLKLGLPEAAVKSSSKTFALALGHQSVYVKLAALRWFQDRPGIAKSYYKAIMGLLDHNDEWVRMEAVRTLEKINNAPDEVAVSVAALLRDSDVEVRKAAAKAVGKICSRGKGKEKLSVVLSSLQEAAFDQDAGVRWKAQKALRQLGEYVL